MAHIYIRDIDKKDWNAQPKLSDLRRALDKFYSQAFVDRILVKYTGSGGYRVYTGSGTTKDLQTFFEGNTNYVDAVDRIRGFDSTRSGDIILLAKDGWYFADNKFNGEHGGLSPTESYIPLIFSGPTIRKGATDPTPARSIDMAKTLADLLGFSMPGADGSILPVKKPK
jgi:arylsulfatase A-like enzyme